jgi:hypothetical protein
MAVRLSALRADLALLPPKFLKLFLLEAVNQRAIVRLERLGKFP